MTDNLSMREFMRLPIAELEKMLTEPVIITRDGQPFFAAVPVDRQAKLVFERVDRPAHDVRQAKVYRPGMPVKPGDRVIVAQGKKQREVTVPEVDGDGRPMPEYD